MLQYSCIEGQSFSDVCLNTYGTMDNYVKLLNDNACEPDQLPNTGLVVNWDEKLVFDQTVLSLTNQNGIIYSTWSGYGLLTNPAQATKTEYLITEDSINIITEDSKFTIHE